MSPKPLLNKLPLLLLLSNEMVIKLKEADSPLLLLLLFLSLAAAAIYFPRRTEMKRRGDASFPSFKNIFS